MYLRMVLYSRSAQTTKPVKTHNSEKLSKKKGQVTSSGVILMINFLGTRTCVFILASVRRQ